MFRCNINLNLDVNVVIAGFLCISLLLVAYSKSPRIRTCFFESYTEIGSYFKDTNTNFKV